MWNTIRDYFKRNWYHWLMLGISALVKWLNSKHKAASNERKANDPKNA